ncbi:MAG TPA: hypothetical protein PLU87_01180 [Sedimentisphaerales bacterium]|nr:hypothetical protein [Sedimentisphaerales bacterium]
MRRPSEGPRHVFSSHLCENALVVVAAVPSLTWSQQRMGQGGSRESE